ncbi:MAG: DUF3768 domain-containing protein [Desulfovibrionaceae bacterium]
MVGSAGNIVLTASIFALCNFEHSLLLKKIHCFTNFNENSDPYGEHDFLAINSKGILFLHVRLV